MLLRSHRAARLAGAVAVLAVSIPVAACSGVPALEAPTPVADGVVGVMFVDRDHDGRHDDDEPALAAWKVGVYGTGPLPLKEATTDEDGRFQLADVEGLVGDAATLKFAPHVEAPGAFDASTSQLHQHREVRLGESVVVPVDDYTLCARLEGCNVDLADLVPVLQLRDKPEANYPGTKDWYLDTKERPGRVLLRFASMTSNLGTGLLHVVALQPPSEATSQPVQQRIYGDHRVFARTAGDFVYHPSHKHFHLDNFETYQLRPAGSPDAVASGTKVSFCLTDIAAVPGRPAPPAAALTLDLPPMSCGTREQGISPGHTDYYGPTLADQWIDVTEVPTGDYELVLTSDPNNVILESDESNNTVSLPLQYTNPLH